MKCLSSLTLLGVFSMSILFLCRTSHVERLQVKYFTPILGCRHHTRFYGGIQGSYSKQFNSTPIKKLIVVSALYIHLVAINCASQLINLQGGKGTQGDGSDNARQTIHQDFSSYSWALRWYKVHGEIQQTHLTINNYQCKHPQRPSSTPTHFISTTATFTSKLAADTWY